MEVSPSFAARNQRRTEALFSGAHRSCHTSAVMTATSGRGSSWDESDSESEAEIVRTIHTSDAPWVLGSCLLNYTHSHPTINSEWS
jgi:hypothetical protein